MDLVQRLTDIDTILGMLSEEPSSHPLKYFRFQQQLTKKSDSLDEFWDTELSDNLGLVDSGTAQQDARADDGYLPDDLYEDGAETANDTKIAGIQDDVQEYTANTDDLYCDLMDYHVLTIQEVIARLTDYRNSLVDDYPHHKNMDWKRKCLDY